MPARRLSRPARLACHSGYPLFAKSGVTLLTGFLGPAERALKAAGHDAQFVPGDFRGVISVRVPLAR